MAKTDASKKKTGELSKREELKMRRKREEQRRRIIPIILIAAAAVVVVVLMILPNLQGKSALTRPNAQGTSMGDPNAPIKVEEFADFQCPSCAIFVSDFEPDIIEKYIATGKVYFQFRPFSFLGPESFAAAEAAYCANDQGKFWEYHDTIYQNQRGENQGWFSTARLTNFAKDLGLNVDTFKSCYEGGKYKQKVLDDIEYGKSKNIDRTPSFLVNGQLAYADTVEKLIESQLSVNSK